MIAPDDHEVVVQLHHCTALTREVAMPTLSLDSQALRSIVRPSKKHASSLSTSSSKAPMHRRGLNKSARGGRPPAPTQQMFVTLRLRPLRRGRRSCGVSAASAASDASEAMMMMMRRTGTSSLVSLTPHQHDFTFARDETFVFSRVPAHLVQALQLVATLHLKDKRDAHACTVLGRGAVPLATVAGTRAWCDPRGVPLYLKGESRARVHFTLRITPPIVGGTPGEPARGSGEDALSDAAGAAGAIGAGGVGEAVLPAPVTGRSPGCVFGHKSLSECDRVLFHVTHDKQRSTAPVTRENEHHNQHGGEDHGGGWSRPSTAPAPFRIEGRGGLAAANGTALPRRTPSRHLDQWRSPLLRRAEEVSTEDAGRVGRQEFAMRDHEYGAAPVSCDDDDYDADCFDDDDYYDGDGVGNGGYYASRDGRDVVGRVRKEGSSGEQSSRGEGGRGEVSISSPRMSPVVRPRPPRAPPEQRPGHVEGQGRPQGRSQGRPQRRPQGRSPRSPRPPRPQRRRPRTAGSVGKGEARRLGGRGNKWLGGGVPTGGGTAGTGRRRRHTSGVGRVRPSATPVMRVSGATLRSQAGNLESVAAYYARQSGHSTRRREIDEASAVDQARRSSWMSVYAAEEQTSTGRPRRSPRHDHYTSSFARSADAEENSSGSGGKYRLEQRVEENGPNNWSRSLGGSPPPESENGGIATSKAVFVDQPWTSSVPLRPYEAGTGNLPPARLHLHVPIP